MNYRLIPQTLYTPSADNTGFVLALFRQQDGCVIPLVKDALVDFTGYVDSYVIGFTLSITVTIGDCPHIKTEVVNE